MIAYIEGKIVSQSPTQVIIECNGIGYQVHISLHTYHRIQPHSTCRLLTHLYITENAHQLYGFADEAERSLFLQLIAISGIGPNTARTILSSIAPEELQQAVLTENSAVLESIKGIGPKSAKRIILELKDKLAKQPIDSLPIATSHNIKRQEALSALMMLGFSKQVAEQSLNKVLKEQDGDTLAVEELVKRALKNM